MHGRKVINLDSEDYDTITTGAAGACLQFHELATTREPAPADYQWFHVRFEGGLGGHSGVDINKGRISATVCVRNLLQAIKRVYDLCISEIKVGEANASIASSADLMICVPAEAAMFVKLQETVMNKWMQETFGDNDPNMHCSIRPCKKQPTILNPEALEALLVSLKATPQGMIKMSEVMENTVETSNNIGVVETRENCLFVSTHSRSFIDADLEKLSDDIATVFKSNGFSSQRVMMAPAWQEDQQSAFLQLTSDTFNDVLGWRPRMVAMHFVLEAGYFVQTYPGIQIASIGPRIVEPHSTSERIELSTIDDIWKVLLELLARLATA